MILASAAIAAGASLAKADTSTNLLINPGAETGTTAGYTVGGTSNPGVDDGSFESGTLLPLGKYDFYGHTGASGTLSQSVDVSTYASSIDTGTDLALYSFYERSNPESPADTAGVSLLFENGSNTPIGDSIVTPLQGNTSGWAQYSSFSIVPVGTRTIVYTMDFVRGANGGNDLDAFIDDNNLQLSNPLLSLNSAAAPLPASSAGIAGLLGLAAGCSVLRRKPAAAPVQA